MAFSDDKKLLRRIAQRLEALAKERYDAAMATGTPEDKDRAKRTRDNEMGDVLDLKDLMTRLDRAQPPAPRFGAIFNVDARLGVLVPVDPTPEMIVAGANFDPPTGAGDVDGRWRAMVEAIKRAA